MPNKLQAGENGFLHVSGDGVLSGRKVLQRSSYGSREEFQEKAEVVEYTLTTDTMDLQHGTPVTLVAVDPSLFDKKGERLEKKGMIFRYNTTMVFVEALEKLVGLPRSKK